MSNKKILIMGGSGTIGASLAKQLKKQKYEPILIARNKDRLESIANEVKCEYFVCDVLETKKLVQIISNLKDEIYGLAYCVGSINLRPLKLSSEEDFLESYKINTLGAINSIKASQASLTKNKGAVLLFSTIAVQQGFINHTIISSSKGAIEGITLSLAAEFSPNIRVNCIAPSLVDSQMTQNIIKNENIKKAIEVMHPIPSIGRGTDFSDIGSYLLGENNRWITGQIIHIDGGRSTLRVKG